MCRQVFTLQVFVRGIYETFVSGIHLHFGTKLRNCLWNPGKYRHKIVCPASAQFGLVMINFVKAVEEVELQWEWNKKLAFSLYNVAKQSTVQFEKANTKNIIQIFETEPFENTLAASFDRKFIKHPHFEPIRTTQNFSTDEFLILFFATWNLIFIHAINMFTSFFKKIW